MEPCSPCLIPWSLGVFVVTGLVFDIQRYAVHDGPGIRTLVFLKGCPLRCPWCCNPESQRFVPELKRSAMRCRACGSCAGACPGGLDPRQPEFDRRICETCDSWTCLLACPHAALGRVGREMTATGLLAEVLKDRAFYENSGGGVTLSGGEPLSQAPFALEFFRRCKEARVHSALETCGCAPESVFRDIEPFVDLFLFDLKIANQARHREVLGAPLAPILDNLRFLAARRSDSVVVRVPLVPTYTDDEENLRGLAGIASEMGLLRVELEPYHALGEGKYRELGREPDPSLSGATVSGDRICLALEIFRSAGLAVSVHGF
jgi:pyruvate formate lyase activating enzyme